MQAQWTNGGFYGATVLQAANGMVEVRWDDGSPNLWVRLDQLRADAGAGQGLPPGMRVMAQWTNGHYYGATVIQSNATMAEVRWDDGSPNLWVRLDQMRAGAAPPVAHPAGVVQRFALGAHVEADWKDGMYYAGRIEQWNGSEYLVRWDDGTGTKWVPAHQVRERTGVLGFVGDMLSSGRTFAPGQPVLAPWTNGALYNATVIRLNGPHAEVAWEDGSPNLWVETSQLQAR